MSVQSLLAMAAVCIVCCNAAGAAPPTAEDAYRAYSQMQERAQAAWLDRLLVGRIEPAARLALSDEAFARRQAHHKRILAASAAGRRLSAGGVAQLLADLERFELAAMDAAARQFRMATYDHFRSDRAALDAHRAAWSALLERWTREGKHADDRPKLIDWLRAADSAVRTGTGEAPLKQPMLTAELQRAKVAAQVEKPMPPAARPAHPAPKRVREPSIAKRENPQRATVSPRPVAKPAATRTAAKPSRVRIDTVELAARIEGHNLALARLLDREADPAAWTMADVRLAVAELEDLAERRADLEVYLHLTSASERAACGRLESSSTAVTKVAAHIARLRAIAETEPDPQARSDRLSALKLLSQRLSVFSG